MNDSGNVLGQFCYVEDEECLWLLSVDTVCEKGGDDTYPVLVNTDVAAAPLSVYCFGKTPGDSTNYEVRFLKLQ